MTTVEESGRGSVASGIVSAVEIQTTLHERLEGGAWVTSMEVVLTRVD
jgi:hypothetical protein